jgi:hypothetical protein
MRRIGLALWMTVALLIAPFDSLAGEGGEAVVPVGAPGR